jgi:starch synthase
VGGLADVVFGLSRELQMRGNSVEIILPKYDCMRYDHVWGLHVCYQDLWVPWWGGKVHCSVWYGEVHGRRCYFIEPHHQENYFNRGHFYGSNDDHLRFAFFSRAAIEFLYKAGKHPEIIHCHDWQTGLVPVFLYEIYQHLGMWHSRVVFTIHNFKHQGVTGEYLLWATELGRPGYYFHHDRLRDNHNPHAVNMMKGGIVYSNFVTTVSPNHAWEAKGGQGHGLENTLHVHEGKYGGVVNGVDYDEWNPEVDRYIPHRYGIYNVDEKYRNKKALRDRLWIADSAKPIVAYIGRLDDQKGLDLVRHALFYSIGNDAQFVLLGSAPDPRVGHDWWNLKQHLNDHQDCHIELGFNEELSHLIYAGADLVVVPSKFEPCGLTQLVSMRYGTVPVVRAVGGLADTVFDKDYDWRPLHERNGYVFQHYNNHALEVTLHRAFACYWGYPEHFRHLMLNGMRYDYSWNIPGQHYLNIYDYVRDK